VTTTQALQLSSGDEVGQGYCLGIVMRTTANSVSIFWEDHRIGETTTYARSGAELGNITLRRKASRKAAGSTARNRDGRLSAGTSAAPQPTLSRRPAAVLTSSRR
jgi:hypothetical protein